MDFPLYDFLVNFNQKLKRNPLFLDFSFWKDCFLGAAALFKPRPKNLGTVQHFCNPEEQKCCTVPKFLRLGTKNLGTVQHFCNPEEQKCCTVPKISGLGLKSAVLSLKNLKKPILQNLQGLPSLNVLENRFFRFFKDSTALFNEKPKTKDSTALLQSREAKVLYCP